MEKIPNKYSAGKFLSQQKGLRKKDPLAKPMKASQQMENYLSYLKAKGVKINKLMLGEFTTKNGLPYSGFMAEQDLLTEEPLIRVPRECLLTTKDAYLSDIKKVFQENSYYFHEKCCSSWEDHMLLFFLLYEYQKQRNSKWYHLIQNLPKELDYVIFWDQKNIKALEDPLFEKLIQQALEEFNGEYSETVKIMKKYPKYFDPICYDFDNIKWIHTHLVTRCFGKFLQYVTMVPIVEMLNHECSDVYYDFDYKRNNPDAPKDFSGLPEPKKVSDKELEDKTSSEGSYNSKDQLSDGDYDYENEYFDIEQRYLDSQTIQSRENRNKIADTYKWMKNSIDLGDAFSHFYVGQIMLKLEVIAQKLDDLPYFETKQGIEQIQAQNKEFRTEILKYYNEIQNLKIRFLLPTQERHQKKKYEDQKNGKRKLFYSHKKEEFPVDSEWPDDKFDEFVMKNSSKDQFQKGAQVYFCYGRLSNRMMLLRYGMSLEYNKYNHVHIRLEYFQHLQDSKLSIDLKKFICFLGLSKYKRFKIKYTHFNFHLLFYFRAKNLDIDEHTIQNYVYASNIELELQAISETKAFYENYLKEKFSKSLKEEENSLTDKTLGYHEHFTVIYRLERQRIIQRQIQLLNLLQVFWSILKENNQTQDKKYSFTEIINLVKKDRDLTEINRDLYLLQVYFKTIQKSLFK